MEGRGGGGGGTEGEGEGSASSSSPLAPSPPPPSPKERRASAASSTPPELPPRTSPIRSRGASGNRDWSSSKAEEEEEVVGFAAAAAAAADDDDDDARAFRRWATSVSSSTTMPFLPPPPPRPFFWLRCPRGGSCTGSEPSSSRSSRLSNASWARERGRRDMGFFLLLLLRTNNRFCEFSVIIFVGFFLRSCQRRSSSLSLCQSSAAAFAPRNLPHCLHARHHASITPVASLTRDF